MDFDATMAWVNEHAQHNSTYKEKLNEAGGIRKVDMGNGTVAKVNMLTGALACVSCASCGTLAHKMATCAGCGSVNYCSRECQKANWPQHKTKCKEVKQYGTDHDNMSNFMQFFINQPGMCMQLAKASIKLELDGELPVVSILRGKNDRRAVLSYGGLGTKEFVNSFTNKFPCFKDLFRRFDVEPPQRPVIVIIHDGTTPTVVRCRVMPRDF